MDSSISVTNFLFIIAKEVKNFYETPVIFVNQKDYSDDIFNTLCKIRTAIAEKVSKEDIMDIVVDFHLQWLRSVNDLELFRKRIYDITREEMLQAISFTIDAMGKRLKYFQKYVENQRPLLTSEEWRNLQVDVEIMEDMNKEVTYFLLDKLKCFRCYTGDAEFQVKFIEVVDELLNWMDKINDRLTIQFTTILKGDNFQLALDLTKMLKDIIDEVPNSTDEKIQKMLKELTHNGQNLINMVRSAAGGNLEIRKILEKIASLDVRIKILRDQNSSAVMGLENKKKNLEERLASLENIKSTLQQINIDQRKADTSDDESCTCPLELEARIFNHLLPVAERQRLVTDLCYLWDKAVFGQKRHKSIISILSATDAKEEFTDEVGTFYVDVYGRKIYKQPNDENLYQQNEENKLVPVKDDEEHIYHYDRCGRYFIDKNTNVRIYKAHATASEYMMGSNGVLLKMKEERDGVTYYYDSYGRYYVDDDGKHIYRESDSFSEYECDGFGNLVRIRTDFELFTSCPDDVQVSEDTKYLKETVAPALRKCIAECILYHPTDPIKYLSDCLVKYRSNMELKDERAKYKEQLMFEREIRLAEERAAAELAAREAIQSGGSEASYDSNLINYSTLKNDNIESVESSTK